MAPCKFNNFKEICYTTSKRYRIVTSKSVLSYVDVSKQSVVLVTVMVMF